MIIKTLVLKVADKEGLVFKNLVSLSLLIKKITNFHKFLLRRARIRKYYTTHDIIKLHFGCGKNNLEGFLNTDLFAQIPIDITEKLPFNNDSVDLVYSNHVVEHIYNWQFRKYMAETFRILNDGGIHIIATPCLEKLFRVMYVKKFTGQKKKLLKSKELEIGEKLDSGIFLNRQMHINYGHKFLYDYDAIRNIAEITGYKKVVKLENRKVPDAVIKNSLLNKNDIWNMETETYLLMK